MKEITKVDIQRIEDCIKLLDQKDLLYLNNIIVDRLKLLSRMRSILIGKRLSKKVTAKKSDLS